jgi:tetratricopeptide (TPR) repeat protein
LVFDKILENDSQNISSLFYKGLALLDSGQYELAAEIYDEAIKIDPENPDLWNNRGLVSLRQENFEEAIEYFDEAIRIDPHYQIAKENKAIAENRPATDAFLNYLDYLIIIPIIAGAYLIQYFRNKKKKERLKKQDTRVVFSPFKEE